jgi:PAS domain S-box-containing protein
VGGEAFALILLGVAMPEMTGFEGADRLKKDERTSRIPILFLTAIATGLEEIYRAYRIGAVDYLIKPLNIDAVRSKAAVFADLYRQRLEIERRERLMREAEQREHAVRVAHLRAAGDQRYRKLLDGMDHAFAWTADAEGHRLSFVSRRAHELLGYPAEQFLEGGFLLARVLPEDRDATRRSFGLAVAEGHDQVLNHRLVAADGSARWFHTIVGIAVDPETERVELHGLSADVEELKSAEERQRRLALQNARLYEVADREARARDELLQVVSHDLRNPLGSVLMSIQRARAALATRPDVAPAIASLDRAERAAQGMRRLVDDLVDLEAIQAGKLSMDRQPHDLGPLLADAVALVEPRAQAKDIELRVDADPARAASLCCDRDRMLQILSNLLDNAVKFSPQGSRVVLVVQRNDDVFRFGVSDTGPGIEPAQLPYVFDRRWQAKEWARFGLGLGLSIARGLVEAHQGRIWAESEPGKGSTFFFTVPAGEPRELR